MHNVVSYFYNFQDLGDIMSIKSGRDNKLEKRLVIRVNEELRSKAQKKAGRIGVSEIMRMLLEKWVSGEIVIKI